jgi:hypothetical protein
MQLSARVMDLDKTLEERGSRYGSFMEHARLTQELKKLIFDSMSPQRLESLEPDQREAIDMICHKLGRIGAGDPHYSDSWLDIAGYAKLVADRLDIGKTAR